MVRWTDYYSVVDRDFLNIFIIISIRCDLFYLFGNAHFIW